MDVKLDPKRLEAALNAEDICRDAGRKVAMEAAIRAYLSTAQSDMDEATLAALTAYDNCSRLPEDVMGYGPMRAALTAALPHLQNAALKEKAGD